MLRHTSPLLTRADKLPLQFDPSSRNSGDFQHHLKACKLGVAFPSAMMSAAWQLQYCGGEPGFERGAISCTSSCCVERLFKASLDIRQICSPVPVRRNHGMYVSIYSADRLFVLFFVNSSAVSVVRLNFSSSRLNSLFEYSEHCVGVIPHEAVSALCMSTYDVSF